MKSKSLFSRLLENKKLMLLASFLLAFVFWIISSDNISKTVEDISIKAIMSESAENQGLKVYGVNPETISVEVSGKRLIVDSLTADSFEAKVDLFNVTTPGTNTYTVEVDSKSNMSFSIDKVDPEKVTVFVDKEDKKTLTVHNLLMFHSDYKPLYEIPGEVSITGPQSIIDDVKSAYVTDEISSTDGKDVVRTLTVHLCDKEDPNDPNRKEITNEFIKISTPLFENVKFSFSKVKELPLKIKCDENISIPEDFYAISPSKLSVVDNYKGQEIVLDIGSLSAMYEESKSTNSEYVYKKFKLSDIFAEDSMNINSNDGIDFVSVTFDFSKVDIKSFQIDGDRINGINVPEGSTFKKPSVFNVTVVGALDEINNLNPDDFEVEFDFSHLDSFDTTTIVNVPPSIKLNTSEDQFVWAQIEKVGVTLITE